MITEYIEAAMSKARYEIIEFVNHSNTSSNL